jgi:hypothetical protein
MPGDQPHLIKWKAGEIKVHGNSRKYLLHVLAEYIMQDDAKLVTIEPLSLEESFEQESKSRFDKA